MAQDRGAFPSWLVSLDERVAKCKSCGAPIKWGRTSAGRKCPVDAEPEELSGVFESHFVTCPNADEHRAKE